MDLRGLGQNNKEKTALKRKKEAPFGGFLCFYDAISRPWLDHTYRFGSSSKPSPNLWGRWVGLGAETIRLMIQRIRNMVYPHSFSYE